MTRRALVFGEVAEDYERYRPGYPDQLVRLIGTYAGTPIRTALEIGAGTGKATRGFAARGIAVTATDPDPEMLAELRRHVPGVRTRTASFEQLASERPFDLVFAAAALHWTTRRGRWPRMAALLRPGGVFASFGAPLELADADLAAAVRAARTHILPVDDVPPPDGTPAAAAMQWPGTELVASALFTEVRQVIIARPLTMTAENFVGQLSTVSAYRQLPGDARRRVLIAVREVLPERVDLLADVVVHLAVHGARRPDPAG